MPTILVIGGTGGNGESFARRFHANGKMVIITGRRVERLRSLAAELPGLSTIAMDNADLASLPGKASEILQQFPDIITVWVNSAIQKSFTFTDNTTSTNDSIVQEITTIVTAPMILA